MLSVNGISREPTGLSVNGVKEFFATEGELWTNGQEHYDFFRRYGVSPDNLKLWLDQSAIKSGTSLATWLGLSPQANDQKQLTASYQPSLSNTFKKDAARDFDGSDNFMAQKEYEDESGATFWPTNAGAAFNATNARFRVAGVDLSPFASAANDYMLVIHDGSDKTAMGYIGLADSAYAATNDYTSDFSVDEDGFIGSLGVVAGNIDSIGGQDNNLRFTCDNTLNSHVLYKTSVYTVGLSYRLRFSYYIPSGQSNIDRIHLYFGPGNSLNIDLDTLDAWTSVDMYFTMSETLFRIYAKDGTETTFQDAGGDDVLYIRSVIIDEVTHVGADGVLIMATKGGSTQSWALQESGIDLNDIDSFEVLKTDFQITAALSAFMWVKPDDGQPAAAADFISKYRAADGFRSWALVHYTDSKIGFYPSSDGIKTNETKITDAAFFADGQETWHQIGFVWNGITCVLYGDGVALDSTTGGGGIPASLHDTSEKLTIGALSTPANYFAGLIGPTVLASRAYSAGEASRLFNADRARFGL